MFIFRVLSAIANFHENDQNSRKFTGEIHWSKDASVDGDVKWVSELFEKLQTNDFPTVLSFLARNSIAVCDFGTIEKLPNS